MGSTQVPGSQQLVNAIRFLSVDAIERAKSGHPGMPLGMAEIASILWRKWLKHNPANPRWWNRDRFVLSNGHGSMLLYSLLYLTGYKVSISDLKNFRQLHSKTPGHPEYMHTPGVESTTGPLGQGLANAVGMALAEKTLAAEYNTQELTLVDHRTYAFVSDGCMMEGISHEVCSLAGTLGLNKLIVCYDDNGISIDGPVETWFSEDTAARFRAYNWRVIGPVDGHDQTSIENALSEAHSQCTQPTLIVFKTIIGYGSRIAGSARVHGSPLGAQNIKDLRIHFSWPYAPFEIPDELLTQWSHLEQGSFDENSWLKTCQEYKKINPEQYAGFLRRINGDLPDHWAEKKNELFESWINTTQSMATRSTGQQCLAYYITFMPELFGGSADLTGPNLTSWSGCVPITSAHSYGNYLHYGVREFGMAAIMNGIALHGGLIPYGGTFLVFSDYARNAIRLSALMKQRVIYILTHDSIGIGEDGPTHQPIEHAAMLRMTPNLFVWRPADGMETAVAWSMALETHNAPSCLLLSRQILSTQQHTLDTAYMMQRGGYILQDCAQTPQIILIATGSEVQIALDSADQATKLGIAVRVVSMPCAEKFLMQSIEYQEQVLPQKIRARIAIEASATAYWYRFVGLDGIVIGIDQFGLSAPGPQIYQELGITVEHTLESIITLAAKC